MCFSQDAEVADSTTDSGVSIPATDGGNEESQAPQQKAPVRFGWLTGVMVGEAFTQRLQNKDKSLAQLLV